MAAVPEFMKVAVEEGRKGFTAGHGGPFGAVVVKDNKIVGRGHNRVLVDKDPTCHAEIVSMRDACKNLGTHDLTGCELYTTHYPCPMCACATEWANIENVYYGCAVEETEKIGFRDKKFYEGSCMKFEQVGHEECWALSEEYVKTEHTLY